MRNFALVIGVLLLVAGGLISAGVLSFDKEETVAKLGSIEITATETKKPTPTVGYGLLGAGVLALVIGALAKK
jgi:hypothetical protein